MVRQRLPWQRVMLSDRCQDAVRSLLQLTSVSCHCVVCSASNDDSRKLRLHSVSVSSSNTAVTKSAAVEYSDRILTVTTLRRSFAEYCKHFVARFNHVHASGYNSARSVRIQMKFGALRAYCLELARADFGRDPRRSESGRSSWNFVSFCEVNNARLCRFPVSQISRNLLTRHGSMSSGILSENICENLP